MRPIRFNHSFYCLTVFLLFLSNNTPAQEKKDTIAIRAGQIIDGTGNAPIKNGVLVIQGSTIKAVGQESEIKIPSGAKIIEVPNETLLPGLIDTPGHLSLRYGTATSAGVQGLEQQLSEHDGLQMTRMVRNSRAALLSGVTTTRMTG